MRSSNTCARCHERRRRTPRVLAVALLLVGAAALHAATPAQRASRAIADRVASPPDVTSLRDTPAVRAALDAIRTGEPRTIEDQARLCEIPAPPFKETARAEAYAAAFRAAGLKNVRIDRAGNVIGERGGQAARPHLVLGAHLDTIFP